MPSGWGYNSIRMTEVSQQQARLSATGLIIGKFIEVYEGNQEPLKESINALMSGDADLIGGVTLTLLNLLTAFVSNNYKNPDAFQQLGMFLIETLADDTPSVQRILK